MTIITSADVIPPSCLSHGLYCVSYLYLFTGKCHKIFTTTHWTLVIDHALNFLCVIKTRLTKNKSTTHCEVRISTLLNYLGVPLTPQIYQENIGVL